MDKKNEYIQCVHEGIILKQFKGVVNVEKGDKATVLEKEKSGTYIIGVNGQRCVLHRSFLNSTFIPTDDRFAYFETLDK